MDIGTGKSYVNGILVHPTGEVVTFGEHNCKSWKFDPVQCKFIGRQGTTGAERTEDGKPLPIAKEYLCGTVTEKGSTLLGGDDAGAGLRGAGDSDGGRLSAATGRGGPLEQPAVSDESLRRPHLHHRHDPAVPDGVQGGGRAGGHAVGEPSGSGTQKASSICCLS